MNVGDLCQRLRQYEGRSFETTACYNGLRDEAAGAIETLNRLLRDAYGLLWLNADVEARKLLLGFLSAEEQAAGIEAARARARGRGQGDLPGPVRRAAEMLRDAALSAAEWGTDVGSNVEGIKYSAAAVELEYWAEPHRGEPPSSPIMKS